MLGRRGAATPPIQEVQVLFGSRRGRAVAAFPGWALSAASGINDAGAVVGLSYTRLMRNMHSLDRGRGTQDLTPDLTSIAAPRQSLSIPPTRCWLLLSQRQPEHDWFPLTQERSPESGRPALSHLHQQFGTVVGQSPVAKGYRHASPGPQTEACRPGHSGGAESSALSINNKGWSSEPP